MDDTQCTANDATGTRCWHRAAKGWTTCPSHTHDFTIHTEGTIVTFEENTDAAKDFVQHHIHVEPWQWCGAKGTTKFAVDHRPARGLRNLLVEESFLLEYK